MRRLLKTLLLLCAFLLAGAVAFLNFGLRKIGEHYLEKLFRTSISINSYSISYKNFPQLTIHLNGLDIGSTLPHDSIPVVAAPRVSIRVNCLQFLDYQDTIIVEQILLSRALIRLKVNQLGAKNFQLFPPYDSTQQAPKLIKINECLFQNLKLNYQFTSKNRNYWFDLDTAKLKFDIYKHDIDFNIQTNGKIDSLQEHTASFLHNQPLKTAIAFNFRKRDKNLTFAKAHIWISDVLFEIFGDFLAGKERYYHLNFKVSTIQLEKLLSFLPKSTKNQLSFLNTSGDFKVQGKIIGKDDLAVNPYTELIVESNNAKLLDTTQKNVLYSFSLGIRYNNGIARNAASSTLLVDINTHFESTFPLNLSLKITKFEQMYANLAVNGIIPLSIVANSLLKQRNYHASGILKVNFLGEAPLKYLIKQDSLHLLKAHGNFELNQVAVFGWLNPNIDLSLPSGKFQIIHNKLICDQLNLDLNSQKFKFAGYFENVLPYLTGGVPNLVAKFTLRTDSLFIDSLLKLKNTSLTRKNKFYDNSFYIPKRLSLQGDIFANHLFFRRYCLDKVKLSASIDTHQTASLKLAVSQQKDSINLYSRLLQRKNYIDVQANLSLSVSDISQTYAYWAAKQRAKSKIFTYKQEFSITGGFSTQFQHHYPDSFWVDIQGVNGHIGHPNQKFSLRDIHFDAALDNRMITNKRNQSITLKNISTIIDNHLLNSVVTFSNFSNPTVSINLYANLSVPSIMAHLPKIPIESVRGKANFGLFASFPLTYLSHADSLFYLNSSGFVDIDSLNFVLSSSKLRFSNIHTRIEFDSNSTQIKRVYGKVGTCAFSGSAKTKELLPYIFLKNKWLSANVSFYGDTLNLAELLVRDNQRPEKGLLFDFPNLLNLAGDFLFQSIYYERFNLKKPTVKLQVIDRVVNIDTIHAESCDGEIGGKISVNAFSSKSAFVKGIVNIENINLKKLFYSLNNFNQDFITDKNLSGVTNATISYQDSVPYNLETDFMNQQALLSLKVQAGALDSFYLFNKLSPFINKDALAHARFTLSADSIQINKRIINVPQFQLHSNIINLVVSGYQTFDLEMNYFLWFERVKRRKEAKGKIQLTPQFLKTILVFKITGTYPDVRFGYDISLAWKRIWGRRPIRKVKPANDFWEDF